MPKSFLVRKHLIEEILKTDDVDRMATKTAYHDDVFHTHSVSLPDHLFRWLNAQSKMEEEWRSRGNLFVPPKLTTSIIYPSVEHAFPRYESHSNEVRPKVEVAKTFLPIKIGPPRSNFYQHHNHPSSAASSRASSPELEALTVASVRTYPCLDCGKTFQRASSLSNHRLIHKNVKAFGCDKCGMKFLRKSDLGKHMVIHSGVKPYACDVCNKTFSQSSNMLTHRRRHSGMRPFHCKDCGKAFYRKVDVRRHARVHLDDLKTVEKSHNEQALACL